MDIPSSEKVTVYRSHAVRLLLIPFLVYGAWFAELFLLSGNRHLFSSPDSAGLLIYTLIACVATGMIIPVICIHRAFVTGAVNMFQIGFRSARRTVVTVSLSAVLCYGAVAVANPFGADKGAFIHAFLLLLPTAIAGVMICWVLIGTHLQACVRRGGALISIVIGVVVTSLLFGIASLAGGTAVPGQDTLFWSVFTGVIAALVFFAVRDIYATVFVVTEGSVFTGAGGISPLYLHTPEPVLYICAILAGAALIGVHGYLSQNYATILMPVKN
jgi:hypothetical protein